MVYPDKLIKWVDNEHERNLEYLDDLQLLWDIAQHDIATKVLLKLTVILEGLEDTQTKIPYNLIVKINELKELLEAIPK